EGRRARQGRCQGKAGREGEAGRQGQACREEGGTCQSQGQGGSEEEGGTGQGEGSCKEEGNAEGQGRQARCKEGCEEAAVVRVTPTVRQYPSAVARSWEGDISSPFKRSKQPPSGLSGRRAACGWRLI